MSHLSLCALVASVVLFSVNPVFAQDEPLVHGRVVDADGKPAGNVQISDSWRLKEGRWVTGGSAAFPRPEACRTDSDGRFVVSSMHGPRPINVMAIDDQQQIGGVLTIEPKNFDQTATIRMGPLVKVFGRIDSSAADGLPLPPTTTTAPAHRIRLTLTLREPGASRAPLVNLNGDVPRFEIRLPPGDYWLRAFGAYVRPEERATQKQVSVTGYEAAIDLGTYRLKPEVIATYLNKLPPPLKVTDARGVSKNVKLSDFHGKVVVVEFWGVGCGICVAGSLPKLAAFTNKHKADQDKFVILAFHDPSARDFEQLDPYLEKLEKEHWQGQPLPFPILLDVTGQTIRDWGIWAYPTAVLIDREGKVRDLQHGGMSTLRSLEFLLAESR